jgi:hypothetical protein
MGVFSQGKFALAISDRSGMPRFLIKKWLKNGQEHGFTHLNLKLNNHN